VCEILSSGLSDNHSVSFILSGLHVQGSCFFFFFYWADQICGVNIIVYLYLSSIYIVVQLYNSLSFLDKYNGPFPINLSFWGI